VSLRQFFIRITACSKCCNILKLIGRPRDIVQTDCNGLLASVPVDEAEGIMNIIA
jgi:hypothetical protein